MYTYAYHENNTFCLLLEDNLKESLISYVKDHVEVIEYKFELLIGVARVHPEDKFVKKIGRSISEKNIRPISFSYMNFFMEDEKCYVHLLSNEEGLCVELSYTRESKNVRFKIITN